jgi:uncharacterized membrane protein YfcA
LVKGLAPGIVLGSMIGSLGVFAILKGAYLAIFFGLFVGFSATQMFLDKKPAPSRQVPGTAGLMGAVMMGFAFVIGSIVGATHNGTLYPLAIIASVLGIVNFASVRLIAKRAVLA